ncbi:TIGR04222 domain-containing membrane protein [Rhodococcoides kyotonense]|uniref:TIGR04222 domain-containing protein n=1 Tax=Rhodococcoides kyotonense TaxID=398843 RepID=A0A239D357_9NOCA|nr:TIGR04222 domain-containing membrane protein [Rhodococcus kyotonensis]SNS26845.1 TIGR04222 domain-containing protein [Rhodococcus kyotonensis]
MSIESSTATWGIDGPTFLRWYIALAIAAVAVPALATWATRANSTVARALPRPLTPPEAGALISDRAALHASLAILRTAGVLKPGGSRARALTAEERTRIDWFTRAVLERIGSGMRPPNGRRLMASLTVVFAQLRSPLVDMGYLTGPRARAAASLRTMCVTVVVAVGVVRIFAGLSGGKPVLFLVFAVLVLAATIPLVRRAPRLTATGRAEVRRLTADNAYLAPRMRPSFTTYGPSKAGMSAALFGGAALLWVDPALAGAMISGSGSFGSSDSGGFDGSGSSSSCGSSGSSSSCGGGGGCGG